MTKEMKMLKLSANGNVEVVVRELKENKYMPLGDVGGMSFAMVGATYGEIQNTIIQDMLRCNESIGEALIEQVTSGVTDVYLCNLDIKVIPNGRAARIVPFEDSEIENVKKNLESLIKSGKLNKTTNNSALGKSSVFGK